ncbi:MAG: oligosaccharyl transferase, archaeosortase A system-associated [Dehalococcoidales bacterium]
MNDESTARGKRLSPGLIAGLSVALLVGVSLFIRAYLPHEQVFSGDYIRFSSIDAYFHMRLIDSLVHNFPNLIDFDPYLLYPSGINLGNIHFFDWFLAGIIWVFSLGSPTQHTVDVIAVFFPAVLGALTVIPVYFIGKELFGRGAGVIAAGLIAMLPGEYLGRSILGFTDHHVAETLFSTVTMMFLIMAIKRAQASGLMIQHLWNRDWKVIRKPIIYSLLTGLSLGIYLVTWIGGLLFVFIILLYFFIQFIIDHLKRNSTDYLLPAGTAAFLIALIIYVIFVGGTFTSRSASVMPWLSLLIGAALPTILHFISRRFTAWKIKSRYYYPISLFGLVIVASLICYAIFPNFVRNVFDVFNLLAVRTIIEMQPFLYPRQEWTASLAWGNFNTNLFLFPGIQSLPKWFQWIPGLSLISLVVLVVNAIRHGDFSKNSLLIWSLVILLATLGQRRFAYYLAVNVALLTGYISWQFFKINRDIHPKVKYLNAAVAIPAILLLVFVFSANLPPAIVAISVALLIAYIGWQLLQALEVLQVSSPKPGPQIKIKHKKRPPAGPTPTLYYINIAVVTIILFFLVFFPNITPARAVASEVHYAPPHAWVNALAWMKENTPEPFDDSSFYYQIYEPPPPDKQYDYPDSAYAVMAWVDYGYWITRIAQRPVNRTPGPGGFYVANFFLSQDENSSQEIEWKTKWEQEAIPESAIIDKLDAKYIVLDSQTTMSKLWALTFWSEQEQTKYFETYLEPHPDEENTLVGTVYLHPEYYRSLAVRLYNFDGKAVTPQQVKVVSFQVRPLKEGGTVKVIDDEQFFPSYEKAQSYISEQESGQFQVVGDSPLLSPVPLEALKNYKLVYSSPESTYFPGVGNVPSVKIFEYLK